jgi:aspartate aminotransferase-like enzyme
MAERVRDWARRKFALFCESGYESDTLTCVRNTRNIDIDALNATLLAEHDCIISNGYGKLKNETFRIAHMGDMQETDIEALLGWIDEALLI